jgi:hypothetical protein
MLSIFIAAFLLTPALSGCTPQASPYAPFDEDAFPTATSTPEAPRIAVGFAEIEVTVFLIQKSPIA